MFTKAKAELLKQDLHLVRLLDADSADRGVVALCYKIHDDEVTVLLMVKLHNDSDGSPWWPRGGQLVQLTEEDLTTLTVALRGAR